MFNECLDYVYVVPDIYTFLHADIIPALKNLKTYFSNLEKCFDTVNSNLLTINDNLNVFSTNFNTFSALFESYQTDVKIYLQTAVSYLGSMKKSLTGIEKWYYPQPYEAGIEYDEFNTLVGWRSFWSTFRYKKFDEVLLDVHNKIQDEVNPLSDNNKDDFNANIDKLKSDTAVGSALELKEGVQTLYSNISGATPTASLNVNLLPVKFYGASIPSKTIKIDFSWYAPYRDTALSLWRFFLWTAYLFVLFKQIPSIIQGVGVITDHSIEMQEIAINDHMADDYYQMLVNNNGVDDIRSKS